MTAVGIILAVCAVLAGLLILPIHVYAAYEQEEWTLRVRYGVIYYRILPMSARKKAKKEKKQQAKQQVKASREGSALEKLKASAREYCALARQVLGLVGPVRRAVVVDRLILRACLYCDDPADLAMQYGQAWAVLSGAAAVLENVLRVKRQDLRPVCVSGESDAGFTARLRLHLTPTGFIRILWNYGKNRPAAQTPRSLKRKENLYESSDL